MKREAIKEIILCDRYWFAGFDSSSIENSQDSVREPKLLYDVVVNGKFHSNVTVVSAIGCASTGCHRCWQCTDQVLYRTTDKENGVLP